MIPQVLSLTRNVSCRFGVPSLQMASMAMAQLKQYVALTP